MKNLMVLFAALLLAGCASAPTPSDTPIPTTADLPDLVVTRAQNSLEPRNCFSSSSRMIIYAIIYNQGTGDSGAFDVEINGQMVSYTESLPTGESVELHSEFMPSMTQVEVEIDPENLVAESDETNNTSTSPVLTFTPPAPCTATPTP